jgi:hypothetical protein
MVQVSSWPFWAGSIQQCLPDIELSPPIAAFMGRARRADAVRAGRMREVHQVRPVDARLRFEWPKVRLTRATVSSNSP